MIKTTLIINTISCLEAELSDYFYSQNREDDELKRRGMNMDVVESNRLNNFMGTAMRTEQMFHTCHSSSVKDAYFRRSMMRDEKGEANMKDYWTFLFMTIFMPKVGVLLSSLNLVRNLAMNAEIENERVLDWMEYMQVGRFTRLLLIVYPVKYFI